MSAARPTLAGHDRLPDFCSTPILFALLLVAALTVVVMALAPAAHFDLAHFTAAIAFAVWLAILIGVVLCKTRALLLRLPRWTCHLGVWLLMVLTVAVASTFIGWLDHALGMTLTPASLTHFVLSGTAVTALIGAALLRYFYVVAQWQARQAASARAQVEALQARIRPHFLFNSMNTAAALVQMDPDAAETLLEDLAELFRAALGSDGESTLGEELALADRYLAIEQWRLGERLCIERNLANLPHDLPMPRLLLQPLVENAVVHGIAPRREGGVIRLSARAEGDGITLRIDNPAPLSATDAGNGHGLDNVRQRLAYHFGPRARLDVTVDAARFTLTLHLPGGRHARADR
ncbi:MAG TPA: histidine kinase [Rhodanobacteraceae bacterium]